MSARKTKFNKAVSFENRNGLKQNKFLPVIPSWVNSKMNMPVSNSIQLFRNSISRNSAPRVDVSQLLTSRRNTLRTANKSLQPKQVGVGNSEAFQVQAPMPRSAGKPLPNAIQAKMEALFGVDFSDVRIHVGRHVANLGAVAFTHGNNVHFAPGKYDPMSIQGQKLLAHELTHVVQQRMGKVANPFGNGVAVVVNQGFEAEADRMGVKAASGPPLILNPKRK